ncbi:uncharacterized protein METZ01_LOCUS434839, partial [marine metagenome]
AGGGSGTKTLGGAVTVAGVFTVDTLVTTAMEGNNLTVTDETDINGTITISTATLDANGAFDATGGTITFTDAGNLNLDSTVTSLGTLSDNFGTVIYDGVDQVVFSDVYYSLTAGGGSGTKTLAGAVTVAGDLTIDTDVTIAMDTHDLTVTNATDIDGTLAVADNTLTLDGSSDIDGTITISTGTVDANGTFDATSGFVTFTNVGNLTLFSTVIDLGTLSNNFSTVIYDGVDQVVFSDVYYNLTAGGGSGTKTLGGNVTVENDLT